MQVINHTGVPFGYMLAQLPADVAPDRNPAWAAYVEGELNCIRQENQGYVRKEFQAQSPYCRYFKRFKKTYMVMLQLESVLFKGRGIPPAGPLVECMFLSEMKTTVLAGVHDRDKLSGGVLDLRVSDEVQPFPGLHGEQTHVAKGELYLRDAEGIICGIQAGPDIRTAVGPKTRNAIYFAYGVEGLPPETLREQLLLVKGYLGVACPGAVAEEPVLV